MFPWNTPPIEPGEGTVLFIISTNFQTLLNFLNVPKFGGCCLMRAAGPLILSGLNTSPNTPSVVPSGKAFRFSSCCPGAGGSWYLLPSGWAPAGSGLILSSAHLFPPVSAVAKVLHRSFLGGQGHLSLATTWAALGCPGQLHPALLGT